jgi:hypothetical protein
MLVRGALPGKEERWLTADEAAYSTFPLATTRAAAICLHSLVFSTHIFNYINITDSEET